MRCHPSLAAAVMLVLAGSTVAQSTASSVHSDTAHTRVLPGVVRADFAGQALSSAPWFSSYAVFLEGQPLSIALDPALHPQIVGRSAYLFVVAHKSAAQWANDPSLIEVRQAAQTVNFAGNDLASNTIPVQFLPISGDAGAGFGVDYDLVLDMNFDNLLDEGDIIDGLDDVPGMTRVRSTQLPGPYAVTEVLYNGGTWLKQDIYYPSNIASLGQLPLVCVSHGNGHNYQWYDHIGYHLASYGYIVMSHSNNTGPGIETASQTTLDNTDHLLGNQGTIAAGVLQGHIDSHRITWFGHSRGGEGVARAYDKIYDHTFVPVNFGLRDIRLISSIAPTDFEGPGNADPHGANFSLWVGGADADVNGCADCDICQSFHLLDRATGNRQSISLHGVGHGAFHDGGGDLVASGPCIVSRADTHELMKAYMLPLVKYYIDGVESARDFLWRQWETFQPLGVPTNSCIVVDKQFFEGGNPANLVIDDFQTNPAPNVSSSGGAVIADVDNLVEGRLDDADSSFTPSASDPMNGMTEGSALDTTRGVVFGWNGGDRSLVFEVPPPVRDVHGYGHLSFRAAQLTRDVLTTAELGDLNFEVALRDANGLRVVIRIGAYGGGVEEPYQRTTCGGGVGWGNEFETVRIPLADYARANSAIDLAAIRSVEFLFGPTHGSNQARLGLDDLEFTKD